MAQSLRAFNTDTRSAMAGLPFVRFAGFIWRALPSGLAKAKPDSIARYIHPIGKSKCLGSKPRASHESIYATMKVLSLRRTKPECDSARHEFVRRSCIAGFGYRGAGENYTHGDKRIRERWYRLNHPDEEIYIEELHQETLLLQLTIIPSMRRCIEIAREGHEGFQGGRTTDERKAQAPWGKKDFAGLGFRLLAGGIMGSIALNATVGRMTDSWIRDKERIGPGWLGMGTAIKRAVGILGTIA